VPRKTKHARKHIRDHQDRANEREMAARMNTKKSKSAETRPTNRIEREYQDMVLMTGIWETERANQCSSNSISIIESGDKGKRYRYNSMPGNVEGEVLRGSGSIEEEAVISQDHIGTKQRNVGNGWKDDWIQLKKECDIRMREWCDSKKDNDGAMIEEDIVAS
jgi:hypothetical protein